MQLRKWGRRALAILAACTLAACGGGGGASGPGTVTPQPDTPSGRSSFISADTGSVAGNYGEIATALPAAASTTDKSGVRSVQEGDIYRLWESGASVVNLNAYRGLQVIDIRDPASPRLLGQAALNGSPLEMYQVGQRAVVLLNGYTEYQRVKKGSAEVLERFSGAAVLVYNLSNPASPQLLSRTRLSGYIQTSRLVSGGGKQALYLAVNDVTAASDGAGSVLGGSSVLHSFSIASDGSLSKAGSLSLPGYLQALQATPTRLLLARQDVNTRSGSRVSVIDISDPDGKLVQGGEVSVSGQVARKTNLDMVGNVLRVASSDNFGVTGMATNHAETFDFSQLSAPKALDHKTFGAGQQLFATRFLADRAFFVTYLRKDPFHAFSVGADGKLQEHNEFIVSGWNDFFFPVLGDSRLVGVGYNDTNNTRALSISLYDITRLENPTPLVARADMDLNQSWSEATWDDRAFTVLDGAVSQLAPDGKTRETGLILLPFTGWVEASAQYRSGVQVFTYSATTLTRRGSMLQDSQVRRSFVADAAKAQVANLSDSSLSLFQLTNVDQPQAQGSLALAPSFSQFVAVGNVGVRYHDTNTSWWGTNSKAERRDTLEIVPLDNAAQAQPLASIAVRSGARIYAVADRLVVLALAASGESVVSTYDLSTPAAPRLLGELVTKDLPPNQDVRIMSLRPCMLGICPGAMAPAAQVVGSALVFPRLISQAAAPAAGTALRYWSSYGITVLDLSTMAKPQVLKEIALPTTAEAVGVLASGTRLWINHKTPDAPNAEGRAQARYAVQALDLSTASAPVLGKPVSVPGELKAINGSQLLTVDRQWNGKEVKTSLHRLLLSGDLAYEQASTALDGLEVNGLANNGSLIVLSAMQTSSWRGRVLLLNQQLQEQAALDLDAYTGVKFLTAERLVLQAAAGLLVYDVRVPSAPLAQAYLATSYYSGAEVLRNNMVYVPAGAFGLWQFDLSLSNLSPP